MRAKHAGLSCSSMLEMVCCSRQLRFSLCGAASFSAGMMWIFPPSLTTRRSIFWPGGRGSGQVSRRRRGNLRFHLAGALAGALQRLLQTIQRKGLQSIIDGVGVEGKAY